MTSEIRVKRRPAPVKEWSARYEGRAWGPVSLSALITLIRDEAFPAPEAEVAHVSEPDAWKPLSEEPRLIQIPIIRNELCEQQERASHPRSRSHDPVHESPGEEPPAPIRVEDFIRASRMAETANFKRHVGTPPAIRETDDSNDVVNQLRELRVKLDEKKEEVSSQAKKGELALRSLLGVRLLAAAALASKSYFIMEGTSEFLVGVAIFLPLVTGLRWALKTSH